MASHCLYAGSRWLDAAKPNLRIFSVPRGYHPPMNSSPTLSGLILILRTVAAPGLAAILVWAALVRPLPRLAAPAGALAGLLLGWALGFGPQAAFPPVQTLDWLPWLLSGLALAASLPRFSAPATAAVLLAGLAALAPPLLTEGDVATLAMETGAAGLGSLGFVTTLGGSIVIGGLANSAFAVAAVLWWGARAGRVTVAPGLLQAGAVAWLWLAFSARHLAELPLPETLLAAAALASAALPRDGGNRPGWRRMAADLLPPAVPALAAVGWVLWPYVSAQLGGYS